MLIWKIKKLGDLIIWLLVKSKMKNWTTLIGFCFAGFTNGIGFGIYTCNLPIYAAEFQTTVQAMQNTFYIGLVF